MPLGKKANQKWKKLKYRNKVNSKLLSNHQSTITKTRKLTQPTKRLDCAVTFDVKKLFRFPEFKIDTDTKCNRSVASKKRRNSLEQIQTSVSTGQNNQKKYDKIKSKPHGICYEIPFKTYLINRMKFCANPIYINKNCFHRKNLCSFLMFIMHMQT